MYFALKSVHVACAVLSIGLFFWRWQLALRASALLRARWLRVLPHVNDSLLLAAALGLSALSGQYPFVVPWVTAKVLGLIAYIVAGMIALKAGSKSLRWLAGLIALVLAFYIVSVALTKDARGIFTGF